MSTPTTAAGITGDSLRSTRKAIPTIAKVENILELQEYLHSVSLRPSVVQEQLDKEVNVHPVGGMSSSRDESQFLAWLVALIKAKKVIEVGVFLGATTLAIAQALPEDGKVLALDVSDEFTSVGAKYWKDAGVAHKIDLQLKPAVETLTALSENPAEVNTFDFAFVDADKPNYDSYYELCLKLLRPGGVLAVDNVLWHGCVIDPENHTPETVTIRTLNEKIHKDPRVDITLLSIADGVTLFIAKTKDQRGERTETNV